MDHEALRPAVSSQGVSCEEQPFARPCWLLRDTVSRQSHAGGLVPWRQTQGEFPLQFSLASSTRMRRHLPGMRASSVVVSSDAGQLLGRARDALAGPVPTHHDSDKRLCGWRSQHPAVLRSHILDGNPKGGPAAWAPGTDKTSGSLLHDGRAGDPGSKHLFSTTPCPTPSGCPRSALFSHQHRFRSRGEASQLLSW